MSENKIPGFEYTDVASFQSREEMVAFARGILAVSKTRFCVYGFEFRTPNHYYCFYYDHDYPDRGVYYEGNIAGETTVPITVENEELT